MKADSCPYCGKETQKVMGNIVYPSARHKHLWGKRFIICHPCNAYVGCHPGNDFRPMGRLANKELRRYKIAAHDAFDVLWKTKEMNRKKAYFWLSTQLGIKFDDCHIGMFDVDSCRKVIDVMKERIKI